MGHRRNNHLIRGLTIAQASEEGVTRHAALMSCGIRDERADDTAEMREVRKFRAISSARL